MQDIQTNSQPHNVIINQRESLSVTGVVDVSGFDEQTVNILTTEGNLIVKGESLHISTLSLDTGQVSVDGRIISMQYLGDSKQQSFMSRIFR